MSGELRQNLSVYLNRVKKGEALQVTEHGHVVAVLGQVPANTSRIDILIAQGLVTPATRSLPRPAAAEEGAAGHAGGGRDPRRAGR